MFFSDRKVTLMDYKLEKFKNTAAFFMISMSTIALSVTSFSKIKFEKTYLASCHVKYINSSNPDPSLELSNQSTTPTTIFKTIREWITIPTTRKNSEYPLTLNGISNLLFSSLEEKILDTITAEEIKKSWMTSPRFIKINKELFNLNSLLKRLFRPLDVNGRLLHPFENRALTEEESRKLVNDISALLCISKSKFLNNNSWGINNEWENELTKKVETFGIYERLYKFIKNKNRDSFYTYKRLSKFLKDLPQEVLNAKIRINNNEFFTLASILEEHRKSTLKFDLTLPFLDILSTAGLIKINGDDIPLDVILKGLFRPLSTEAMIHHPIEDRYLTPAEQEKLTEELAFYLNFDKNNFLSFWEPHMQLSQGSEITTPEILADRFISDSVKPPAWISAKLKEELFTDIKREFIANRRLLVFLNQFPESALNQGIQTYHDKPIISLGDILEKAGQFSLSVTYEQASDHNGIDYVVKSSYSLIFNR
jgi:hypothetical protein